MTNSTNQKEVLLCGGISNFENDLVGFCSVCDGRVYLRPLDAHIKTRWCISCAEKLCNTYGACRNLVIPKETVHEIRTYLRQFWDGKGQDPS